ncbi:NifB/NifX family molybdenum-iron cluster-binding protein [Amphritea sp.]|uniref:NifB/NifX family molybdenum-iron cluster-binding protein n=1 Tax=Amphritea sp. TaxID=1872502 RepID=UPI003D0CC474
MKIAVASRDGISVAGHIGKCKSWIIFQSDALQQIKLVEMITLPRELVFHYYKDDMPHPLVDCDVVIGASAGDNFVNKMALRGINAVLTAETDPEKAVVDYLNKQITPPKPRPIGGLVCKVRDALSSHN